ncbi:MAG: helix-turn-helix domain-containing protein [Anaerolineales bacterium]|jgi:hypothetical protein
MKSFGELLKYYRRQSTDSEVGGMLTQERLGELIGDESGIHVSGATISNWERNKHQINKDDTHTLYAIIKVLHDNGGIKILDEANNLLNAGNYRALNEQEIQRINQNWVTPEADKQHIEEEHHPKSGQNLPEMQRGKRAAQPMGKTDETKKMIAGPALFSIEFDALIKERTTDFIGREHVFSSVDNFIRRHPRGYFTIEGDPGVGKSAILAEYVRKNGCIAHFNIRSQSINRPAQFLENVSLQLISRFDLPYTVLPPEASQNGAFLARLLNEASRALGKGEKIVIAVDALDEVDFAGAPPGGNILYLPLDLPESVYFVMTRREAEVPFSTHSPQQLFKISEHHDHNLEDVRAYLKGATQHPHLRKWIMAQGLPDLMFINIMSKKSEDNFMYLRHVIYAMEEGIYQDVNIEELPVGLKAYYADHWVRMGMQAKPLPRTKLKIIYILSEVRQPVSSALIADFASEDVIIVQEALDEWRQFLHEHAVERQTRYSLYHTSFRDFLHKKEIIQAAGVSIKDINTMLADNLWGDLFGEEM